MTTPINQCKCGKPVNQLVIIKGSAYYLCEKHVQTLEKLLGEKLEPLTRNYEPNNLWIQSSSVSKNSHY